MPSSSAHGNDPSVASFVRSYYDALRSGEALGPFFSEDSSAVKFGISETLRGTDAIRRGLREQTRTTEDWTVESRRLTTGSAGNLGWFSDHVELSWRNRDAERAMDWETRWSGTVHREDGEWSFVLMHVSAPHEL